MTNSRPHDRRDPATTTDVWLTPPSLIEALGTFDLDPCASPAPRPWTTAANHYDITCDQNGLELPWAGRVWCNPPFSTSTAWIRRMVEHQRGILLLPANLETSWWRDEVWPFAAAILLVAPRVAFLRPDGSRPKNGPTKQTSLVAFSAEDAEALERSNIRGTLLRNWQLRGITNIECGLEAREDLDCTFGDPDLMPSMPWHDDDDEPVFVRCPLCGDDHTIYAGNRWGTQACCYRDRSVSKDIERWTTDRLLEGGSIDDVHAELNTLRTHPALRSYVERIDAILNDPRTAGVYMKYLSPDYVRVDVNEKHESAAEAAEVSNG